MPKMTSETLERKGTDQLVWEHYEQLRAMGRRSGMRYDEWERERRAEQEARDRAAISRMHDRYDALDRLERAGEQAVESTGRMGEAFERAAGAFGELGALFEQLLPEGESPTPPR